MKIERYTGEAMYHSTGMDNFSGLIVTYDDNSMLAVYQDVDGTVWSTTAYRDLRGELNLQDNLYESNQNHESMNEAMRCLLPDWNLYWLDME